MFENLTITIVLLGLAIPLLVYKFVEKANWEKSFKFLGLFLVGGFVLNYLMANWLPSTLFENSYVAGAISIFAVPFLLLGTGLLKEYKTNKWWMIALGIYIASIVAGFLFPTSSGIQIVLIPYSLM